MEAGGLATGRLSGLRLLAVDEHVIVVDKPAGMPSVPARTPLDPADVAAVLRAGGVVTATDMLEAVHRLDRDTSGVLVLARSAAARSALGTAFARRAVRKRYLAIVHGQAAATGVIDLPLGDDPDHPPRKRVDATVGRRAITRWERLAVVDREQEPWSVVALEPVTGRSHQLRAHMAWLGTAIVGDRLYGRQPAAEPRAMALHAAWIGFPHPVDGRVVHVLAPLPATHPWTEVPAVILPAWAREPSG
jgi:tRNA pseudouridine32 synthase/23S rRNA pseudouridine746 synthase